MTMWRRAAMAAGLACLLAGVSCETTQPAGPGAEGAKGLRVDKQPYGKLPDGREVDLYTLTNAAGMRVKLITFGALTVGVEVPARDGQLTDVTLGYAALEGWLDNPNYFGATVGRYANRIA